MDLKSMIIEKAAAAKKAESQLAMLPTQVKNQAIEAMADALFARRAMILAENAKDLEAAREKGLRRAMLDRLMLNEDRLSQMADGLRQTAGLPDPIGQGCGSMLRPNGLEINKIRVPLGVIGIIYEARPNVTADAIGLCLKSGNAVMLRGGSEAIFSNLAISSVLMTAAYAAGIPEGAVQFIETTDRQAVQHMLRLSGYLDVIIPRGGKELIKTVVENSSVPVIETGTGVCHLFVDESADFAMACNIAVNAKTSRPAVCNSIETLLVHESIAAEFLPLVGEALLAKGVELRGCAKTCSYLKTAVLATEEDWSTEYSDLILSIKIVPDLEAAMEHIEKYNTRHSETIVTRDYNNARRFQHGVDAAAVYVNASTRFTDGFEFGFGAEIGISTQKLHARGPMGLNELTSTKYLISGEGQVR
ncbi:MAG: glutamate-5-semialdehyde dehydrogenase [Selenomonadaceae bacterium]